MYMVQSGDGRPMEVCENLPKAFSSSLAATGSGEVGRTVTVVAIEKVGRMTRKPKTEQRVVGTFKLINRDEVWCVTPMFPGGTIMRVDRGDDGVPVRRFASTPKAAEPAEPTTYCRSTTESAAADLRSLLGMVQGAPLRD